MKIVNDNIKNALKQPTTQRKGRILVNDNYYEVYNVEYYADTYLDGNVVGNAIASQLDFDLPYMDKFQTFKYFDGVWTGSAYEYIDIGTFHVFDEQDEDEFNKHITAFDNLIKFNAPFNDVGGYPKTLFQELQNICNQAGVELQNMSIVNGNFQIVNNQFVNGESLKTVLKAICQISGTYATIKDDKLVLQLKNETNEIINKSQHQPVTWKRKTYGINQVVLGMSDIEGEYVLRQDDDDIAENGVHKLVINDNPFTYTQAKRDELIDALFNQVRGFGYIPYEMNCEWLNYLEIGDTVIIDDIETIVLRISGRSPKSLESFMSAPAIIDSSIAYVDNTETVKNQLKRTEIIVDKNNQSIQSVVEQTEKQNQKIAQVTQTVEELNSKISDIADITTSAEDTDAKIEINEVNQSEPIRLVIRPIGENISYLYPSDNLYPSDDLFMKIRTIRFHNNTTNEDFDYELPDDLLYYDSENYDEFILDYDGQSCVINKKVGYNADGTTYVLDTPKTVEYEFPKIVLSEGDYTVSILSYENGYIFARLMAKNIYTTQFYTKAEVDSEIAQTAQSIDLSVNSKLSNYSTTTEMNSAISLKASEITSSVSSTYATKNELTTAQSTIKQTTDEISAEVSKKVNNTDYTHAKIVAKINDSTSSVLIEADKINLTGYLTISSASNTYASKSSLSSGTTTINGGCITTGTIDASKVTVKNLNADNITSGTLSANKINGGTITASAINLGNGTFSVTTAGKVTATSGSIGGWNIGTSAIEYDTTNYKVSIIPGTNANKDFLVVYNKLNNTYPFFVRADGYVSASNINITGGSIGGMSLSGGVLSSNRLSLNATSGILSVFNNNGGSMILSNACRLSATAGVGISANSTGNISAPSSGIDIKGCSGSTVYIGCMNNSAGTTEKSCVSVENGILAFRSSGYATYNGSTIWGSSSLATKENISDLTKEQKDEVYELIKNISLKKFDYKEQYSGQKNNYGFIIEDIENTYLKTLLHISQSSTNEDIKNYSTEDLARLELVVIQELMKKIERLEEQINVN